MRMRSKPEIPSDVENVDTESCIRKEQKEVSFVLVVTACDFVNLQKYIPLALLGLILEILS